MNAKKKKNSPAKDARRRVASQLNSQYVTLPIDEVLDDENNENEHSDEQIVMLRASVREFQQVEDVLITADRRLVAGHGIKRAMKLEGFKTISCKVTTLTGARRSAYRVGTNQLARLSHFDPEKLRLSARSISEEMGVAFDPNFIGFDPREWELILTGRDWHGTSIDPAAIPEYDPDSETFLIKIEGVLATDKETVLTRVGRALKGTQYEARVY
jgi:hypothetical protein